MLQQAAAVQLLAAAVRAYLAGIWLIAVEEELVRAVGPVSYDLATLLDEPESVTGLHELDGHLERAGLLKLRLVSDGPSCCYQPGPHLVVACALLGEEIGGLGPAFEQALEILMDPVVLPLRPAGLEPVPDRPDVLLSYAPWRQGVRR